MWGRRGNHWSKGQGVCLPGLRQLTDSVVSLAWRPRTCPCACTEHGSTEKGIWRLKGTSVSEKEMKTGKVSFIKIPIQNKTADYEGLHLWSSYEKWTQRGLWWPCGMGWMGKELFKLDKNARSKGGLVLGRQLRGYDMDEHERCRKDSAEIQWWFHDWQTARIPEKLWAMHGKLNLLSAMLNGDKWWCINVEKDAHWLKQSWRHERNQKKPLRKWGQQKISLGFNILEHFEIKERTKQKKG